jgi:16S rRNA (guanine966-N2)-methyltransferase
VPKIIAGSLRGRVFRAPKGRDTRPTSSRVREAIFDVLMHHPTHAGDVPDARVLDLFAGSGGLGIEALSRGAGSAHFVEHNRNAVQILRRNLKDLGLESRSTVWQLDGRRAVERLSTQGQQFDVLLLDPPYAATEMTAQILNDLTAAKLPAPGAVLVLERAATNDNAPDVDGLGAPLVRRWGETEALFYCLD